MADRREEPRKAGDMIDRRPDDQPAVMDGTQRGRRNPARRKADQVTGIEAMELTLLAFLQRLGDTTGQTNPDGSPRFGSADLTLAWRHIEDAMMRARKHVEQG